MSAEAVALLQELVSHPGGVREALKVLGVKGLVGDPCSCPVAVYLNGATGRTWQVFPQFANTDAFASDYETVGSLPLEVKSFIHNFDHHMYPELEL